MDNKSKTDRPKSLLTYLHKKSEEKREGDNYSMVEEQVLNGPKGISFKFYNKKNDKTIKINAMQTNGKFILKVTKDNKVTLDKTDLDMPALLNLIKDMSEVAFAVKYLKDSKQSGGVYHYNGGARGKKATKKKASNKKSSKKKSSNKKASNKKASKKKASNKKASNKKASTKLARVTRKKSTKKKSTKKKSTKKKSTKK
jgi:hypothetical protein